MKYKVTLNNRVYEVEVEMSQAMLIDEYDAVAPPLRLRLLPLWFPQRLPPRLPHPRQRLPPARS